MVSSAILQIWKLAWIGLNLAREALSCNDFKSAPIEENYQEPAKYQIKSTRHSQIPYGLMKKCMRKASKSLLEFGFKLIVTALLTMMPKGRRQKSGAQSGHSFLILW